MAKYESDEEAFELARMMIETGKDRTFLQVVDRVGKTKLAKAIGMRTADLTRFLTCPQKMMAKYPLRIARLLKIDEKLILGMLVDLWKQTGRNL